MSEREREKQWRGTQTKQEMAIGCEKGKSRQGRKRLMNENNYF